MASTLAVALVGAGWFVSPRREARRVARHVGPMRSTRCGDVEPAGPAFVSGGTIAGVHVVPPHGRSAILLTLVASALIGCTNASPDDPGVRGTAVYTEVLRWLTAASSSDPEPLPVFVEPRGEGSSIPLGIQAELLAEVGEIADLRFIDARDEAIVVDDDGTAVVDDGGILVRLSPVDEVSEPVVVDVDMFVEGDEMITLRFELDQVGDRWSVSGSPEQVATPSLDPSEG